MSNTRTVAEGDTHPNPNMQAPNAPPTLRNPGETLPQDDPKSDVGQGAMRPVEFPQQKPEDYPDATNLPRTPQPDDSTKQQDNGQKQGDSQKPAQSQQPEQNQQDKSTPPKPADGQPAPAPSQQQPSPQ